VIHHPIATWINAVTIMRHKVIEMFGARVNWLLDAEAPSSTIESILNTFGRSATTVDVLMLIYPYNVRERVSRYLLSTCNKLLPPAAPAYIGRHRSQRIEDFETLRTHFDALHLKHEIERSRCWGEGVREILHDNSETLSETYLQARLRLFLEFMFGYVCYPHAFEINVTPESSRSGAVTVGWAKVTLYADPAGPSFAIYDGPL
jgi:hypothetical protein